MNTVKGINSCFQKSEALSAFKYLHVGMISEIKRKSLPEIASFVGLENEQSSSAFFKRITLAS
jgi:SRSO17 transposase